MSTKIFNIFYTFNKYISTLLRHIYLQKKGAKTLLKNIKNKLIIFYDYPPTQMPLYGSN